MRDLTELRGALDRVDRAIIGLFMERMTLSEQVGAWKAAHGVPVLDAVREAEVLTQRAALAPGHEDEVAALYRAIMAISRRRQQGLIGESAPPAFRPPIADPRVLYQGEPGAYAWEAAERFFGAETPLNATPAWEDIFAALQAGRADYGVLPIENSSTGGITQVYDLLARYNCFIVGEEIVRVDHCLMALPGASAGGLRAVCSHEQGLLQCRDFLNRHPAWQQVRRTNTAESAKHVAEGGDRTEAAICSRRAGELYGLVPLVEGICDDAQNYTRFVVVAAAPEARSGSNKLSALLTLPHRCGSLYEIMSIFHAAGVDLLKLESRPIRGRSWEYRFFVDFSGDPNDLGLHPTIAALTHASVDFRFLGAYPECRI